ncbi:MAG TPA: EamA/RhaT family transporter [Nevskiaceae bacterium]|nr:EamA/RhaT family transporter [Nevskiaceae bacterium]
MIYVLLSVACSVLVSVLLKVAKRTDFQIGQAVAWNYAVTSACTLIMLQPSLAPLRTTAAPWLALVGLGVLLPTIFLALGASVVHAGIVRTDAAQRLSLLVSLMAAFTMFGEAIDSLRIGGCVLGLAAMGAMVWRGRTAHWVYPVLVFVGSGVIDVLFKRVAASHVPLGPALLAVFTLALIVAFVIEFLRGTRFDLRSFIAGVLLGLFNFGNILFYLQAHRALPANPALVFASMNLGVVALGALVGLLLFRERLNRVNLGGLGLALIAVGLLAHG